MINSHNSVLIKEEEIKEALNEFCIKYLNEKYYEMCKKLCDVIVKKDSELLNKGKVSSWACGIIHALGGVNNLFNKDNDIYIKVGDLYKYFNISSSTGLSKSKKIQSIINISNEGCWKIEEEINKNDKKFENYNKAQELIKEAWQVKNFNKKIKLAKKAIETCDLCVDAYIILSKDNNKSDIEKKSYLEKAVESSLKYIGVNSISEISDKLWEMPEITALLGAIYNLIFQLWNMGERSEAINRGLELLKYDKKDILMIRGVLINWIILENNIEQAEYLLNKYKSDYLTAIKYSKAIVEYIKGNFGKGEELLIEAYKYNKYVIPYITKQKRIPNSLPRINSFRSEEEAIHYVSNSHMVWSNVEGLISWVKEKIKNIN